MDFSPDSATLLTCNRTGVARLWRVSDGAGIGSPMVHEHQLLPEPVVRVFAAPQAPPR